MEKYHAKNNEFEDNEITKQNKFIFDINNKVNSNIVTKIKKMPELNSSFNNNDISQNEDIKEEFYQSEENINIKKNNDKKEKNDLTSMFKLNFKLKLIIIGVIITFLFLIIFFFMIVSGKDFLMLELTGSSDDSIANNNTTTGEIVNFKNIVLNGKNGTILKTGETLADRLGQNKITEWSNLIEKNARLAGYGTGKAPAQAAYDLINEALKENIIIPYLWGGGHSTIYKGVNPEWGAYVTVTASNLAAQPKGSLQPNGLDCSGFVSWALKNGGCTNFTTITAKEFVYKGSIIDIKNAITGDLAATNKHVVIILTNTGTSLIVAEAKGASSGIIFSEYNYDHFLKNEYNIISMREYYATNCKG